MAGPSTPVKPPEVAVRSPTYAPPPAPTVTEMLPRDPFPPQFLEPGESVLASLQPRLLAYLNLPALGTSAISLVALAAAGELAQSGTPGASTLFVVFAATFFLATALWARRLGRGALVLLPLGYFLGLAVAAFVAPVTTDGVSSATGGGVATTWAVVTAEIALFAVLEIGLPFPLTLLAWYRTSYALTDRRAIEVTGVFSRESRWIPFERLGPMRPHQSFVGRWLGYGRLAFVDRHPATGARRPILAPRLGLGVIGAEFYGIPEPRKLAARFEAIVAPARRADPSLGVVPAVVPPTVPAPVRTTPAPTATPPAAPAPSPGARCPRCGTALIFVAPASRFYCPVCGQYV